MPFDRFYVIALPERRDYVLRELGAVGIYPVVFPAIPKGTLDFDALRAQGYISADTVEALGPGRIACHLSHVAVLEKFLADTNAEGEPLRNCLVFEDDIAPLAPDTVTKVARVAAALPAGWDIAYLGRCWDNCGSDLPIHGEELLVRCFSPLCRHAYAVSRRGAQTLVAGAFPMTVLPGDRMYANLISAGALTAYCAKPALFFQNREHLGSTLGNYSRLHECRHSHFDVGQLAAFSLLTVVVCVGIVKASF